MKLFRIVPMFRRNKEVECYIPQMRGFTELEEAAILGRIGMAVPEKRWAFAEQTVPHDYSGVVISQNSPSTRISTLREAQKDIIGYNLQVQVGVKELLECCHAVAVDIHYPQCEQLMSLLDVFADKRTRRIALGIDTVQDFDKWHRYGFDFFIGDFYTKAVIAGGSVKKQLSPVKANKLAVLSEINAWNASIEDLDTVSAIIERDVYLTMSLLKVANSAFFGTRSGKAVDNLRDAVVRIGTKNLREWATVVLAGDLADEQTPEVARVALIRAKFMENIAARQGLNKWSAFMTGLLSVSDVMLGMSIEEAIRELNVPVEILDNLRFHGPTGVAYGIATAYLAGDMGTLTTLGSELAIINELYNFYLNAEIWVADVLKSLA